MYVEGRLNVLRRRLDGSSSKMYGMKKILRLLSCVSLFVQLMFQQHENSRNIVLDASQL